MLPTGETVIDNVFYGSADGLGSGLIQGGVESDAVWIAMEKHYVEGACCGITTSHGRMTAVVPVQFYVGIVCAKIAPDSTYGAKRGIVGFSHVNVAFTKHTVHAFVGA